LFRKHDAFYVPTLVTYRALSAEGSKYGLPADSHRKVSDVLEHGLRALEMAHRGGSQHRLRVGPAWRLHSHQLEEFSIRSEVQPGIDVIRSATTAAARLTGLEGKIGVVAPDAYADLLVIDGDPLENIAALTNPAKYLKLVMKAGEVFVDTMED
jgi:imidazolonepropionase-like amidohydrolase